MNGAPGATGQAVNSTPASYGIDNIVAVTPTFAWGIAYDGNGTRPPHNNSVRAINAAGTDFDFQAIVGSNGFQPANITVPAGVTNNTTAFCGQYSSGGVVNGGGGEVIRTTNGGGRWRTITNPLVHFLQPDGFCNWAYAFDADHVVTGGDPNSPSTQFEMLYTSNANNADATTVTWTRATTPAPLDAEEYMLVQSYEARGNTIWAGTSHSPGGVDGPARVLKSTDQGHTWVAQNTPLVGAINRIAFKDQLNGLCGTQDASGYFTIAYTTDGGTTWNLSTLPDAATADTVRGKFYHYGFSAIPNRGFMSFGSAVRPATSRTQFGASFSPTGINKSWVDIEKSTYSQAGPPVVAGSGFTYIDASFLEDNSVPNGYRGYLAGFTRAASAGPPATQGGNGGIYQVNAGAALATHNAALQRSLSVFPNPSTNGVFELSLNDGIKSGTLLTVFDAMGRQVLSRELSATAVGSRTTKVDLSKEKSGVYTLRLTTEAGIATSKLVVQ